jgi:hypothetical protein
MYRDRPAVDTEPRREFSDRRTGCSLPDEFVNLWRREPSLLLRQRSNTNCDEGSTISGSFGHHNVLTRPFRV